MSGMCSSFLLASVKTPDLSSNPWYLRRMTSADSRKLIIDMSISASIPFIDGATRTNILQKSRCAWLSCTLSSYQSPLCISFRLFPIFITETSLRLDLQIGNQKHVPTTRTNWYAYPLHTNSLAWSKRPSIAPSHPDKPPLTQKAKGWKTLIHPQPKVLPPN